MVEYTVASVSGADAALNFAFFVDRDLADVRFDTGVEGDTAIAFGEGGLATTIKIAREAWQLSALQSKGFGT